MRNENHMKKIPTLLVRDPDNRAHVLDQVTPGCEWVLAGEGIVTRKYDGTCTMLDESGKWWARREVKPGKTAPDNYVLEDHDPVTGKSQGWEPIEQSPFFKFFEGAAVVGSFNPGTYELCGPKINGNPERLDDYRLYEHAQAETIDPDSNDQLIEYMELMVVAAGRLGWEGIVWHHPDGRMAKLKVRDLNMTTRNN